jgi:transposase-like protein
MPTERIAMRRVREMLRLSRDAHLATREVARRTGVAPSTLREMFRRFEKSGLIWPLPLELTDTDLEARLYGEAGTKQGHRRRAEPDWAALNRELKRKHVTLQILWDEYIEANPEPLGAQARHDLLEILEDRYGRRSTLVTSQLPIADWHAVIGEATYADAILDRLVHNAHRLDLSGDSLRRSTPQAQA